MIIFTRFKFFAFVTIWLHGAHVFAQADVPSANIPHEVKVVYYEILDKDSVTLSFEAGKSGLSDSDRANVKAFAEAQSKDPDVKKFIVAAWSDKAYPASKTVTLSRDDEKLANDRKDKTAKYLRDQGVKNIDSYSMAKHPSWISKTFQTNDAKIKGELKDNDVIEKIGEQLRSKGGPGKVVVIAKR